MNITDSAYNFIQKTKQDNNILLIDLVKSGCSGFAYKMEWRTELNNLDTYEIADFKDIKLAYPATKREKLSQVTINLKKEGLSSFIVYENPQVEAECGCGSSVSFIKN